MLGSRLLFFTQHYYLPDHANQKRLVNLAVLVATCTLSIAIRLFSVIRYESVIHEFDPYFNYRSTEVLVNDGFHNFMNWFDEMAWYPLGRAVGPTVFPGLMITVGVINWLTRKIGFPLSVKDICVFVSPVFSALTVIASYLLTREAGGDGAGLFAAAIVAVVPAYISRSTAGSYDNEGIAIFAMVATYYFWVKSLRTGRILDSVFCAMAYLYMVSAWGGYVFIINLIPIHVLVLLAAGQFDGKLYVAYSNFYVIATLCSMQIPFVGFQPVQSSEHIGSFGVFGLIQLVGAYTFLKTRLTSEQLNFILVRSVGWLISGATALLVGLSALGLISPWSGRFYSLLDPGYAKDNIPIIASVSEHQPTAWSVFYSDFFILLLLFPLGLYQCLFQSSSGQQHVGATSFIVTYVMVSVYFSSIMVRLVLVLAPGMVIIGSIGLSRLCNSFMNDVQASSNTPRNHPVMANHEQRKTMIDRFRSVLVIVLMWMLVAYIKHCIKTSWYSYSSPSIVLASHTARGDMVILDDFREAYWWLRQNTDPDAKIMSWWDYGYQIGAIANRTTLVDNNTWNNTHISRVGQAMSRPEEKSIEIIKQLDVDYLLVLFGGLVGFSGDDISKSYWMIRIGGSTETGQDIRLEDYFTADGDFRIDAASPKAWRNSLLYRMCYYRFDELLADRSRPAGFDRVRHQEVGEKAIKFKYIEEAFTSVNWLVRVYKVKKHLL